jgi:beta-lactamase superfamily II metal-dependent hydrolase
MVKLFSFPTVALTVLLCLQLASAASVLAASTVEWAMVNVNQTEKQGDAHLIRFSSGQVFLIDTGDRPEWILPFLKEQNVTRIEKVILSHLHHDHYGALLGIIDSGIRVGAVVADYPTLEICDAEKPWGCNWSEIKELAKGLEDREVPLVSAHAGDKLYQQGDESLRVLYAFDGVNTPVGRTDLNDMSIVLKLKKGGWSALFTGDLNAGIGKYLAAHGKHLKADILKIPHHGAEGLAPDAFFDRVAPQVAMVPAPKTLWQAERCARVRNYFQNKDLPAFVNGVHGTVWVRFSAERVLIVPQEGIPFSLLGPRAP